MAGGAEDEPLPLTLLGGYIVMVHKPAPSMPVIQDVPRNHRDDLPIAILAAGMVNENDLIFFDFDKLLFHRITYEKEKRRDQQSRNTQIQQSIIVCYAVNNK